MRLLRRRSRHAGEDTGATALAEPPSPEALEDFDGTDEELRAEIERLEGRGDDPAAERRVLRLRHVAGRRALDAAAGREARHPDPDTGRLPAFDNGLPEIAAADLTPGVLRAGILRDGCVLVRGLVPREDALRFAGLIERAFAEREKADSGGTAADGFYEEFAPHPRFNEIAERPWIKEGGGVLAADSPHLSAEMLRLFRTGGVPALVEGYLGETPLITVQKTTLRKAEPTVGGAWHQDGAFMGEVRALNLWLSLSRCGDLAPGLDIVPRRLEHFAPTGTDEAMISYQVAQSKAEEAAGDVAIVRPVFEPGDALFFDEKCLHQTASDPSMPNPRYAIENWFFGASGLPADWAPLAV